MGEKQIQEYLVARIVDEMTEFLMADNGLNVVEALDVIYNSDTYAKLQDMDTGIYMESPSYVYELLNTEYHTGTLRPY